MPKLNKASAPNPPKREIKRSKRPRSAPTTQSTDQPPKSRKSPKKAPKKTTHKSTWKAFERAVGRDFGTRRTPLSGGNSGITRSDTMHDKIFFEAKLRQSFALHKLFVETEKLAKLEDKTPVVAIKEKGKNGYLLLLRPEDLQKVANEYKPEE